MTFRELFKISIGEIYHIIPDGSDIIDVVDDLAKSAAEYSTKLYVAHLHDNQNAIKIYEKNLEFLAQAFQNDAMKRKITTNRLALIRCTEIIRVVVKFLIEGIRSGYITMNTGGGNE